MIDQLNKCRVATLLVWGWGLYPQKLIGFGPICIALLPMDDFATFHFSLLYFSLSVFLLHQNLRGGNFPLSDNGRHKLRY